MKPTQESYVPSHPGLVAVDFQPGEFSCSLRAVKHFASGELIAPLTGLIRGVKAYTSVQCGPDAHDHMELNSDLVYINHSCEPNVAFDLSSPNIKDWNLRALKDVKVGDALTFFYPSTEWDMAQAFQCQCGTSTCIGEIQGAAHLPTDAVLARGWANPYIVQLLRQRDANRQCPSCNQGALAASGLGVNQAGLCGCKSKVF